MKNLVLFSFLSIAILYGCGQEKNGAEVDTDLINNPATASGDIDPETAPRFEFEEETFDFGQVSQGEKVNHSFKFTNAGKTDLIITSARGSCGCTVPEYPKHPLKPGETSQIDVVFDSERQSGQVTKSVTIVANSYPATKVLHIKGEVLTPAGNSETN